MGCDFPLYAYRSEEILPSGKRRLVFNPVKSLNSTTSLEIPCGRCVGCRLFRSGEWAIRMHHEAKLYDRNCFITLTYDNQHVPTNFGLELWDWQLFMRKLRKAVDNKIRFFACGEYGDLNYRPHYHAIIFNHDFDDKKIHAHNKQGQPVYVSETLSKIWSKGFCTTQDVTYSSAAYVARYVVKKQNGSRADQHYTRVSPVDGNVYTVRPEFAVMSRKPGLGTGYFEKFKSDFYPSGFVVVNGRKHAPPRFYKKKLTEEEQQDLQRQAAPAMRAQKPERTNARRYARAISRDARIKTLKRDL